VLVLVLVLGERHLQQVLAEHEHGSQRNAIYPLSTRRRHIEARVRARGIVKLM
jgi:hypothetical protein